MINMQTGVHTVSASVTPSFPLLSPPVPAGPSRSGAAVVREDLSERLVSCQSNNTSRLPPPPTQSSVTARHTEVRGETLITIYFPVGQKVGWGFYAGQGTR